MAKYYKFDSGLVLLYETNKINKATSIEITFDCGARCDGNIPGLSHFCEHMFFTGTSKLSKQEVTSRYYDFINVNAYTTNAEIVFTGNIVTHKLGEYLSVVQDMICNSTFKPKAVSEEQKIVAQEIVQSSDNHIRMAEDLFYYELYNLDFYKNGVLGNKQSVNSITSKDVKAYVKKYFVKNNCIISICSPLSFNRVKELIKTKFEQHMPSNTLTPLSYMENKLIECDKVKVYNKKIDKNFLSITYKFKRKGPSLKYRALMSVICGIVDDIGEGLTKELRLDKSLIYGMGSDFMINKVNSYLEIRTETSKENLRPCIDVIIDYFNKIKTNGFTSEQLNKELEKDEYYWQTKVPKPNDVRYRLTRHRFYGRFISDKDVHQQIQSLTIDEVNNEVKNLLKDAKVQLFTYGNATGKDVYTLKQIQQKLN